jgi:lipoyl-dependent peroxiredoxin
LGSGTLNAPFTFKSRFEDGAGTNPEELLGAAHAGCFTMALNARLFRLGFAPNGIHTTAKVALEKDENGFKVAHITLVTEGDVPNMDEATFSEHANAAKDTCLISKALAAVPMSVEASLKA